MPSQKYGQTFSEQSKSTIPILLKIELVLHIIVVKIFCKFRYIIHQRLFELFWKQRNTQKRLITYPSPELAQVINVCLSILFKLYLQAENVFGVFLNLQRNEQEFKKFLMTTGGPGLHAQGIINGCQAWYTNFML